MATINARLNDNGEICIGEHNTGITYNPEWRKNGKKSSNYGTAGKNGKKHMRHVLDTKELDNGVKSGYVQFALVLPGGEVARAGFTLMADEKKK